MGSRVGGLGRLAGMSSATLIGLLLSGCAVLPAAGPSQRAVIATKGSSIDGGTVNVVDVTGTVAQRLVSNAKVVAFDERLGDGIPTGARVGRGDVVEVVIWEAPPAALFGVTSRSAAAGVETGLTTALSSSLPAQMVGPEGTIRVPFAGTIEAVNRTPQQIAADIRSRLQGKAHDPEILVRIVSNATSNVTVVGEVTNSLRLPLTAKGERLLDALASAGGVRQPVGKMTIQVTRGEKVAAMPLETVIKDPRQNIRLQSDDVVTLLFQPYSFTVLGAARANQEVPFEGTGLVLSQALGRMGGLDDQRANPKGVFIFRFEDPKIFEGSETPVAVTKEGKVPVIYRVNMRDPTTLFVAQSFPIKDKDVIYVSNAPLADFAKFLQAISQVVYPIAVIQTTNIF